MDLQNIQVGHEWSEFNLKVSPAVVCASTQTTRTECILPHRYSQIFFWQPRACYIYLNHYDNLVEKKLIEWEFKWEVKHCIDKSVLIIQV